jgi:tRNA U34 5-carboxymethylaminomethyl modifying GTPase MnmE/TrmE
VIRLSGPAAITIVDEVFKGKQLREQPSHTVHFGTIRDEANKVLDEVLVTLAANTGTTTSVTVLWRPNALAADAEINYGFESTR